MSGINLILVFFTLNALILIGFFMTKFLFFVTTHFPKKRFHLSFSNQLQCHYAFLKAILMATSCLFLLRFMPSGRQFVFHSPAKIWSPQNFDKRVSLQNFQPALGKIKLEGLSKSIFLDTKSLSMISFYLLITGFLIVSFLFIRDIKSIFKMRKVSYCFYRYKNLDIFLNDSLTIPFSFLLGTKATVFLPMSLVGKGSFLKAALYHEIQHHRQGDTKWIYIQWILNIFCFYNPILYIWMKELSILQEYACDEILIGQKKISPLHYANCLIAVAEQSSLSKTSLPLCANGLAFFRGDSKLKRRIEFMYNNHHEKHLFHLNHRGIFIALFIIFIIPTLGASGLIQDKRISLKEMKTIIERNSTSFTSSFPIDMNDRILKEINRYAGTEEGKLFFRMSLNRMKTYQSMIKSKLRVQDLPLELMAIPIVESGYQNLAQHPNHPNWGAGIWMFISSTAKYFGLKVDKDIDERLNSDLLTDAAITYLNKNFEEFKDWRLAIMAYNIGEENLRKSIQELKTSDPWIIIQNGRENDHDYLARVIAAIVIMKNPELLN